MEVEEAFSIDLRENRGYTDDDEIYKEWNRYGDRLLSALWDEFSLNMEQFDFKDYSDDLMIVDEYDDGGMSTSDMERILKEMER